jgi:quinol monooxygenase YgiN
VSVNVVVNFQASEGNADALGALLGVGRDLSRAAEGCEAFDLFQRQDDPSRFMFFERWTSIEAHHENMAKNIVDSGHLAKLLPLLAGMPDNGVIELR